MHENEQITKTDFILKVIDGILPTLIFIFTIPITYFSINKNENNIYSYLVVSGILYFILHFFSKHIRFVKSDKMNERIFTYSYFFIYSMFLSSIIYWLIEIW